MGQMKAKDHHVSFGKGRLARAALSFGSIHLQTARQPGRVRLDSRRVRRAVSFACLRCDGVSD